MEGLAAETSVTAFDHDEVEGWDNADIEGEAHHWATFGGIGTCDVVWGSCLGS